MNPQKIGCFLKELRNGKALTQEQLAEQLRVSRRTVSRWETGNNLPDLSILIELADFYEVDLRELLDGERKGVQMDRELKETAMKVADYNNSEKQRFAKRMRALSVAGLVALSTYIVMAQAGIADKAPIFELIAGFTLGLAFSLLAVSIIATGRYSAKLQAFKARILQHEKAEK